MRSEKSTEAKSVLSSLADVKAPASTNSINQLLAQQQTIPTGSATTAYFPPVLSDFGHVGGASSYAERAPDSKELRAKEYYLSYGSVSEKGSDATHGQMITCEYQLCSELPKVSSLQARKYYLVKEAGKEWALFRASDKADALNPVEISNYFRSKFLSTFPGEVPDDPQIRQTLSQHITNEMRALFSPERLLKNEVERVYSRQPIMFPLPKMDSLRLAKATDNFLNLKPKDYSFCFNNCAHKWLQFMVDANYITQKEFNEIKGITGVIKPKEVALISAKVIFRDIAEERRGILEEAKFQTSSESNSYSIFFALVNNELRNLDNKMKVALVNENKEERVGYRNCFIKLQEVKNLYQQNNFEDCLNQLKQLIQYAGSEKNDALANNLKEMLVYFSKEIALQKEAKSSAASSASSAEVNPAPAPEASPHTPSTSSITPPILSTLRPASH